MTDMAYFSRFHFHRIFSAMVGETVTDYLKRVRLQNAALRLFNNPPDSVTDIATAWGFSSSSVFDRAFKKWFGVAGKRQAHARGLLGFPETKSLAMYRDSPDVTNVSKLR
jgi:AraC-like DNA-binding protein